MISSVVLTSCRRQVTTGDITNENQEEHQKIDGEYSYGILIFRYVSHRDTYLRSIDCAILIKGFSIRGT